MGETKLTKKQKAFCEYYIQTANGRQSAISAGYSEKSAGVIAAENLAKPYLAEYISKRTKPIEDKLIATSDEVMLFFSKSMRGEVKDQFGLDPSLSDRINAAKEIARRTIDVELKSGDNNRLDVEDLVPLAELLLRKREPDE